MPYSAFFSLGEHGVFLTSTLQVTYFLQSGEVGCSCMNANYTKDLKWMYTVVTE